MDKEPRDVENTEEEEDFAAMLEQSLAGSGARLEPGQKIDARVLKVSGDWVFLDIGQKGEGVLDRKEILDGEGNPTVAEGDTLSAFFLSRAGGEMRFTTHIGGGGAGNAQLEEAWRNNIPVEGFVEKEIKGGYEVRLPGNTRAFCPYSQMSLRRTDNAEQFLQKHLPFKINTYEERGRNIVVSHRALLEEEQRKQKEALRETLTVGQVVKGTVTSLQKFGAFIDIGGIEGLIPISEIAWGRIDDPGDILSVGQELEVAVKSLDWDGDRFSFSVRDALANPWEQVRQKYPEGSEQTGTVARLAPFGAFVTLEPGIDGLVHISRLGGGKRISHPREVVKEGQELAVKIEKIDADSRRISLLMAGAEAEEPREADDYKEYVKDQPAPSMGTLGDLLKGKFGNKP